LSGFARRLGRAYLTIGRRAAALLAVLAVAAAASVVVALPFWYLATAHRPVFNGLALGAVAGGLGYLLARRLAAARSGAGAGGLRAAAARAAAVAGCLALGYGALWAFSTGRPLLGAAGAVLLLLAVGLTAR
jgi:hypothetical protein